MNPELQKIVLPIASIIIVVVGIYIIQWIFLKPTKEELLMIKEPRVLTDAEAEFMAEYFHCQANAPDMDGYVGHYTLPQKVMKIYNAKHGKERGFE